MFPATTQKGGVHMTAGPLDVCHTPSPGGPIPIPYANMVDGLADSGDKAAKQTKKVLIDQQAALGRSPTSATQAAILSNGDEAGTAGGIMSSTTHGPARFNKAALNVKVEGAPTVRMLSPTSQTAAANIPGRMVAPSQTRVWIME